MLGLLPFQGVVYLLNQYHRALPWAKSKLCPFRAQADKTIHRTHVTISNPVNTGGTRMCGDYDILFYILSGGQYIAEVA